jgi:hypothetical protein
MIRHIGWVVDLCTLLTLVLEDERIVNRADAPRGSPFEGIGCSEEFGIIAVS